MTDEKISEKLRDRIVELKNNFPIFSYNELKKLAYHESTETETLHISLDALQKLLNEKIK